ncbi:PEP/pyruvate-binding domain-containing protein [Dermatophilus congolensis]|nr:PEP/pyruvate-binding domain-containing protein [Dermatophilus congolensis]MBO3130380.1 hypothetical protein [Dermatophilus congolensis]MBO3130989.1 hypothetical protein [Dermatophilus congolensis]MBO3134851.1 hypothetical protein [Dermatophilus congolensis]MBO3137088.1 hypothetical protein [Dermatophilus congolensis]MBO3139332.1 hypothetical protein [Dermatophilus congolensis]
MIIGFDNATLATAGGKAANLGELYRAGFPVPEGFVIAAATYRDVVRNLDVARLLTDGVPAVRQAVEAQTVPDGFREVVSTLLDAWGKQVAVAVRSSATAEDLPEASFAGQQETVLGVIGVDAVIDAVRRCWGSMWTERAVDYRQRSGFDHAEVALAVVVQRLVDAQTSGVMFTRNPVTGADEALIDASWGLGESVVSGAVTPDEFRVADGTILERRVGAKQTRIDRDGAATRTTDVSVADRERACLTEEQVLRLASLGRQVEEHFGMPMDVEWAFVDDKLWVLQARPITTAPAQGETFEAATVTALTRTVSGRRIGRLSRGFHQDLIEHYPGPYPLDVAAIVPVHRQLQAGMATIGIRSTPIEQLVNVAADGTVTVAHPDVRVGWGVLRLLRYQAPDPSDWPAVEAAFRGRLRAVLPADLTTTADTGLAEHLQAVLGIVDDIARVRFLDYVGPAQLTGVRLGWYLRLARRADLDAHDLLGDLDFTTAVIDRELRRLALLDPVDPVYRRAVEAFLAAYGARTTKLYLPFSNRSWREEPTVLEATVAAMRRADLGGNLAKSGPQHENLVAEVRRRLPRLMRRGFDRAVTDWRHGHVAREASVYLIEEAYLLARRVTDEMAERLRTRGALERIDDVKYLMLEEIAAGLRGELPIEQIRQVIAARTAARPRAAAAWWASGADASKEAITGTPGSPGTATGPVRLITGPETFDRLQPGDVLVCQYTDPSWTPLFALASAVVADTGGRLSHAAIVAREYGIPAVMGAGNATTTLRDDDVVTVDGSSGTVALAERSHSGCR